MLTGPQFWRLITVPPLTLSTLRRVGVTPAEVRYPAGGRWAGVGTRPSILYVVLPALTPNPDALYDQLAGTVPDFPTGALSSHCQMLFELLCTFTGRRSWVERSGGSSLYAAELLRGLPGAKVIYLTRERAANVRSMSRHPSFQLGQLRLEFQVRCGFDPYVDEWPADARIPDDLRMCLPDRLNRDLLTARGEQLDRFELMCAYLTSAAEQALADAPPERLLRLRYEDLLADPVGRLEAVGRFLEFDDWSAWASRVAHRVIAPAAGSPHPLRPATPVPVEDGRPG